MPPGKNAPLKNIPQKITPRKFPPEKFPPRKIAPPPRKFLRGKLQPLPWKITPPHEI